ncbi:RHS repeat domain-containing protein [Streptomyces sp. NPDC059355]|uniref:RHS repeat domain-containing protein n=1 Tax=Streptomyces sp. NPDC059355 TaxID=3346811 RepID=UPI003679DA6E
MWQYTYDTRGRQIQVSDPDKGTATVTYDTGDRVTDTTDARGITLHSDYDVLGRRTAVTEAATSEHAARKLTEWTFDTATGGAGQPATSTRYDNGQVTSVSTVKSYSSLYKPATTELTIPAGQPLAGTYKWSTAYFHTGQVKSSTQPALPGLPEEDVTPKYKYKSTMPVGLAAGTDSLVASVTPDHYGRSSIEEYGTFEAKLTSTYAYDDHTGALTDKITDREVAPKRVEDDHYVYDPAGNITAISTSTGQDATRTTDTQCFATDPLRRITEAWTATDGCKATPTSGAANTVGGPDTYWTSYTYDPVGNRKTETQHTTAAGPANDLSRTYTAPPAGKHTLTSVSVSGTDVDTYTYDPAGNMTTRKTTDGAHRDQTLVWNAEGRLASVTQGGDVTGYTYDADGQRLTRKDSTGTTLYLPGGSEVLLKPDGTTAIGTRHYEFGGKTVAMRTGGKITFLVADPQGTVSTQVDADTHAVVRRKTTVFGGPRGTAPTSWIGDKGFVGGVNDASTGLTHLGAREYDPATGRFISVDPLFEADKPQTLGGYAYGESNPVLNSDPTGLSSRFSCDQKSCSDETLYSEESSKTADSFTASGDIRSGKCRSCNIRNAKKNHPEYFTAASLAADLARRCAADPILLDCNPEAANYTGRGPSFESFMTDWVTGRAGKEQTFGDDSEIAELASMTSTAHQAQAEAMRLWILKGKNSGSLSPNRISDKTAKELVNQVILDTASLLGMYDPNKANLYLGSFTIKYQVVSSSKAGVQVRFTVTNPTSISSLLHIATGYGTDRERVAHSFDTGGNLHAPWMPNNTTEIITWRSVMYYADYPSPRGFHE